MKILMLFICVFLNNQLFASDKEGCDDCDTNDATNMHAHGDIENRANVLLKAVKNGAKPTSGPKIYETNIEGLVPLENGDIKAEGEEFHKYFEDHQHFCSAIRTRIGLPILMTLAYTKKVIPFEEDKDYAIRDENGTFIRESTKMWGILGKQNAKKVFKVKDHGPLVKGKDLNFHHFGEDILDHIHCPPDLIKSRGGATYSKYLLYPLNRTLAEHFYENVTYTKDDMNDLPFYNDFFFKNFEIIKDKKTGGKDVDSYPDSNLVGNEKYKRLLDKFIKLDKVIDHRKKMPGAVFYPEKVTHDSGNNITDFKSLKYRNSIFRTSAKVKTYDFVSHLKKMGLLKFKYMNKAQYQDEKLEHRHRLLYHVQLRLLCSGKISDDKADLGGKTKSNLCK